MPNIKGEVGFLGLMYGSCAHVDMHKCIITINIYVNVYIYLQNLTKLLFTTHYHKNANVLGTP